MEISKPLFVAIENYINGKASPAEKQLVDAWYHSFDDTKVIVNTKESQLKEKIDAMIRARLAQTTGVESLVDTPTIRLSVHSWRSWAAVVAFVISATLAIYLYTYKNKQENIVAAQPDFAPAKSTAVLTLADGQKIVLSDNKQGQLAKESGVLISKTHDGQIVYTIIPGEGSAGTQVSMNTVETPRGGKYQVNLPDGTKVWLNAASSLRYPTKFSGQERHVELDGEAYFEVAKVHKKRMPFFVRTKKQTVEVLGTHFNVNDYPDEEIVKTTLLEGSVRVSPKNGRTSLLKPGEQAIIQSNNLNVQSADLSAEMAWKNGEFIFTNNDFRTEMRKVARWYDVDITFDASAPQEINLGGFISSEKNISAVLKLIELTGKVHFKIEGRRILVTK